MKKKPSIAKRSVMTSVLAILLIAALIGTYAANTWAVSVNTYLGTSTYKVVEGDENEDTEYFKSAFSSPEELVEYEKDVAARVEAEGAVLLMNNGALPLSAGNKVSLFSHSSVDPVYGGTGSGDVTVDDTTPTLMNSLAAVGIEANPTLWDFYATGNGSGTPAEIDPITWMQVADATGYVRTLPDMMTGVGNLSVNDVPWDVIATEPGLTDSFAAYGDAAIFMLSRMGGESYDLPQDENSSKSVEDEGMSNYLELSNEEKGVLEQMKLLKDNGTFSKIIVLINTSNAIEVDFLNPEICGTDYGIDAALWIGGVGQQGMEAVGQILAGEVNPSGRLVDVYCYDNLTSPVAMNMSQDFRYANAEDYGIVYDPWYPGEGSYMAYQEGIYVGYRYYETRYEDTVMGTGNTAGYNYGSDVAFPFGYGLSYTTFEWSDFKVEENGDVFDVTVTVTNTGDMAGKEVVEIYFQSPYTDYDKQNRIEKASIELCGFAKTNELAPGESQTVTVSVDKTELRAYDAYGAKTYILDAGDYYFTAGRNAHDALNNVLAAKGYSVANGMDYDGAAEMTWKWNNDEIDTKIFATSATGYGITNQFDNADLNLYMGDGSITYVSRSDWEGTMPKQSFSILMNDQIAHDIGINYVDKSAEYEMPAFGEDNGLALIMLKGLEYDDPLWEELLDQADYDEMRTLVGWTAHQTPVMTSISKPATLDENGPTGLTQSFFDGKLKGMAYPSAVVIASTWNEELIYEVGECIGEDGLASGTSGLYGPATNTHRSPYSGRNFEYYSEDPFIAGKACAALVRGAQSKGMYCYTKHFALNDFETNRDGATTWVNEQAIREIYLESFEKAVVEGGTKALMTGFERIGPVWTGANYGLCVEVLRNEWGFDGFTITDADMGSPYMHVSTALPNGTDCYDAWDESRSLQLDEYKNNAEIMSCMRQAAHRILYVIVNSAAMNGISSSAKVVSVTPWWKTALIALDAVLAAATVCSACMLVSAIRKKKSFEEADAK